MLSPSNIKKMLQVGALAIGVNINRSLSLKRFNDYFPIPTLPTLTLLFVEHFSPT